MDDRLKIFSLWSEGANKDKREIVYDKKYDDFVDIEGITIICRSNFVCGKCGNSRFVGTRMFALVCNPTRYMQ